MKRTLVDSVVSILDHGREKPRLVMRMVVMFMLLHQVEVVLVELKLEMVYQLVLMTRRRDTCRRF